MVTFNSKCRENP